MESNSTTPLSPTLTKLINRLRLYKPQEEDDNLGTADPVAGVAVGHDDRFRPKRAAVLVCIFEDEQGQFRVILTKRASKMSSHSGEVSLPGGKAEEGDADDKATALREANEEIGLDPSLVTVVSVLEPFWAKHGLRVAPVIAVLSDGKAFTPVLNTREVEAIFDVPLEMFLKNENRKWKVFDWMSSKFILHFFNFESENKQFVIWGLTASILIRTASIVYERPPPFPDRKFILKPPRL